VLEQQFQKAEGVVRVDNRRGVLDKMTLRGADIQFTQAMTIGDSGFITHTYSGQVQGGEIVGTVKLQRIINEETETTELPWHAVRTGNSAYFAPTGSSPPQVLEPPTSRSK
jgi:hypothetical protein